jgi:putative two-component system response regulator
VAGMSSRPRAMAEALTARERVLIVDEDQQMRQILARILGRQGYRCTLARDVAEARAALDNAPYDVIVCDLRLSDGAGLNLIASALSRDEALAALMTVGLDDAAHAERAIELGAYGYIVKPFTANDVLIGVISALRHRRAELDARGELRAAQEETIQRLCIAVEARDPEAAPQISKMSGYCWHIGRELQLGPHECELLRIASPMHDVGNVAVPARVLLRRGPLTPAERAKMQSHAEIGYRIMAGSRAPLLRAASSIAWTHHERFDGSGYPRGLVGDAIPLEGRIAAVADVFAALISDRVYRGALPRAAALEIMQDGRGADFDPHVLDAFFAVDEGLAVQGTGPEARQPSAIGETAGDPPTQGVISPREREVLQLAADGRSALEIAEALVVSPGTVKTHFQHIYAKLEARGRAAAVATALRRGLIE